MMFKGLVQVFAFSSHYSYDMESQFAYRTEMTVPVFKIARIQHSTSLIKTNSCLFHSGIT